VTGPTGPAGPTGPTGPAGPTGPTGPQPTLSSTTPPALTPDIAAAVGVGATAARADHVHNVPAAAPAANLTAATANAEGSGASFARNDHSHAITANVAASALGASAAVGTNAALARADHVHPYPTAGQVGAADVAHGHDAAYLRLDASNDPLTGGLEISTSQPPLTLNRTGNDPAIVLQRDGLAKGQVRADNSGAVRLTSGDAFTPYLIADANGVQLPSSVSPSAAEHAVPLSLLQGSTDNLLPDLSVHWNTFWQSSRTSETKTGRKWTGVFSGAGLQRIYPNRPIGNVGGRGGGVRVHAVITSDVAFRLSGTMHYHTVYMDGITTRPEPLSTSVATLETGKVDHAPGTWINVTVDIPIPDTAVTFTPELTLELLGAGTIDVSVLSMRWMGNIPTGTERRLAVNGTYAMAASSWTRVNFDTTIDLLGLIDVASGTVTIRSSGLYEVSASLYWPAPAAGDTGPSRRLLGLSKNGGAQNVARFESAAPTTAGGSRGTSTAVSKVVPLVAGDVLTVEGYQSSAAAVNLQTGSAVIEGTFLSVWKVA
jgi:hypothetical protein